MELGIVMVSLFDRQWEAALDSVVAHGIRQIEPCGGGHIPKLHYDPVSLADDPAALQEFADSISSRGLEVCALACHGNPLHPDEPRRRSVHDDFVATCRIAGRLGVGVVNVLSGCPAGGPSDRAVNWIVNSIFPEFREAYRWQWEECAVPYWREAAKVADEHGVRIGVELHGGDLVYNGQTFVRLRDAVGETIGATVDPSHLFWMGVDVIDLVRELGDAIVYAHAKDATLDERIVRRDGIVPATDFEDWDNRSWLYRAPGYGHGESFWRDFLIALRRAGYDGAVAIELEEPYMLPDDALAKAIALLQAVMPSAPAPERSWFENYEWEAATTE